MYTPKFRPVTKNCDHERRSIMKRSIMKRSDRLLQFAQPILLLLCLAIEAFPAWAQTAGSPAPDPCTSGHEFATTDCTLTWHGITVYGAYDIGVGWVSHGLPVDGHNYEGESLVNRNGYQ